MTVLIERRKMFPICMCFLIISAVNKILNDSLAFKEAMFFGHFFILCICGSCKEVCYTSHLNFFKNIYVHLFICDLLNINAMCIDYLTWGTYLTEVH